MRPKKILLLSLALLICLAALSDAKKSKTEDSKTKDSKTKDSKTKGSKTKDTKTTGSKTKDTKTKGTGSTESIDGKYLCIYLS